MLVLRCPMLKRTSVITLSSWKLINTRKSARFSQLRAHSLQDFRFVDDRCLSHAFCERLLQFFSFLAGSCSSLAAVLRCMHLCACKVCSTQTNTGSPATAEIARVGGRAAAAILGISANVTMNHVNN